MTSYNIPTAMRPITQVSGRHQRLGPGVIIVEAVLESAANVTMTTSGMKDILIHVGMTEPRAYTIHLRTIYPNSSNHIFPGNLPSTHSTWNAQRASKRGRVKFF